MGRCSVLSLQFQVTFGCFYLIGAMLSDSATSKAWETGEPSLVDGIEPGGDWWGPHGHVIEVDEVWNSLDSDTINFIEWLFVE